MRFWFLICTIFALLLLLSGTLAAQSLADQQQALQAAKTQASVARQRSEYLRQEASNAVSAVERLAAQRAVLSAQMDAASAQIKAANARLAIISAKQSEQKRQLAIAGAPIMRLIGGLQQLTSQPTALLMIQPGSRENFVHLRAVMASVEPVILRRTAGLRQTIARQNELRSQELVAVKSLASARTDLAKQRKGLADIEGSSRARADGLSANAAIEFEKAIAQGEKARDLVDKIDTMRESGETGSDLAALDGPILRSQKSAIGQTRVDAPYRLPKGKAIVFGFNEQSETGYRERGIRLSMAAGEAVSAPAGGTVTYAGPYRSYGQIVIIEHGRGWSTLVANLSGLSVSKGQKISMGALLGRANSQNSYVTFELRRNGRPMDIAALLY